MSDRDVDQLPPDITEAVMDALRRHVQPLIGSDWTLTLVASTNEHQQIFSDDADLEGLICGIAADMIERQQADDTLKVRRGTLIH